MQEQQNKSPEPGYEYPITGWEILRVILATLLILFAGFIMVSAVGYFVLAKGGNPPTPDQVSKWAEGGITSLPLVLKALAMVIQVLLIVPAIMFLRRKGLSQKTFLRIHSVPIHLMLYSVVIGFAIAIIGDELSRLMNMVLPIPDDLINGIQQMMELKTLGDVLTIGITVSILAPLVEEMLFRGFFQRYFEAKRGVTSGVLSASAIFAAYHFNIYWLIPILLMATVMGAMAWRTESIVPSFIVHAVNNTTGLAAANLLKEEPAWFTMGDHISPFVLVPVVVILVVALRQFFISAEKIGLGGHGPGGEVGKHVNTTV